MAKITVPAMGAGGVNVDAMPSLLDDTELQAAQNAYHEPEAGRGGALVIRKGFDTFHFQPLSGPVLGGLTMAVASDAGATGGGPIPTIPDSSGSSTGSPGSSGNPSTGAPTGGGPLNPTGALFGGARVVAIGRITSGSNTNATGNKWILCSKGFADTPIAVTGPPGPASAYSLNSSQDGPPTFQAGSPMYGAIHDGWLYYVGRNQDDAGTGSVSTVRRLSATKDEAVASLPTSVNSYDSAITAMLASNGFIWVATVAASGSTHGNEFGRVFRIDPNSKAVQELNWGSYGTEFVATGSGTNTYFPYSMEFYNDQLWVGSWCDQSGASSAGLVITEQPTSTGASSLIQGRAIAYASPPELIISSLKNYSGALMVGMGCKASGANQAMARLWQFTEGTTGSIFTAVITPLNSTGGTGAQDLNFWPSMVEFSGALYASWFNPGDVSRIYRSTTGLSGSWTTELEVTGANSRPYWLFEDDGVLYVLGLGVVATSNAKILYSTSGLSGSYTDVSSSWSGAGVLSVNNQPFPLLFGFEQE